MDTRAAAVDAVRQRIVDASLRVVAAGGAEGITMKAVADEADVALRTIYNHFSSREELITVAVEGLIADTRVPASEVVASAAPPAERLLAFVDAYYRSYERQGDAAAVMLRAQYLPEVDSQVSEVRRWRREQLAAMVDELEAAGELRLPTDRALALLFALTAYATWSSVRHDGGLDDDGTVDVALDVIRTSVLAG